MFSRFSGIFAAGLLAVGLLLAARVVNAASYTLYNVSYDPTRELYQQVNKAFIADYKQKTGDDVSVRQSHGGSGKQSRSVLDGGKADVVTLALAADIDVLATKGSLLSADWQKSLPDNSTPYTSTIVFVVRHGNPKNIHDWPDLIKGGVSVVTADPKSGGGARWNYLAAWGWAKDANGGDDAKARDYVSQLYQHVAILDSGARGSTITFTQRDQGDVLLAWENEAQLALKEFGADNYEIVWPSKSILAEPPVAVVDKNATRDGVSQVAKAYLEYLYTPAAQDIIAQNYYRPRDPEVAKKYAAQFPAITLFTIEDLFPPHDGTKGGWADAQRIHFADHGIFDQIYKKQ